MPQMRKARRLLALLGEQREVSVIPNGSQGGAVTSYISFTADSIIDKKSLDRVLHGSNSGSNRDSDSDNDNGANHPATNNDQPEVELKPVSHFTHAEFTQYYSGDLPCTILLLTQY